MHPISFGVIARRSVIYGMTLLAIAGLFFTIEFAIENFFFDDQLVDIVTGMIGGLLFVWIRRWFETLTDRFFFRKEYDYRNAVRDLGPMLNGTNDLRSLAVVLDRFLMQTVRPECCAFATEADQGSFFIEKFLHDTCVTAPDIDACKAFFKTAAGKVDGPLFIDQQSVFAYDAKRLGVAAIIPLAMGERHFGMIFVGRKLSGASFDAKDRSLFFVLSHQMGMVARNIVLSEMIDRRHGEQEDRLRFLGDIAHELQTPMAILRANVDVMCKKAPGDRKTAPRVIEMTLDRMSQMVTSFLSGIRLNFSKEELHKTSFEAQDLLEEVYADCSAISEEKGVGLFYSCDRTVILGDRKRIRAVILNLVSNALKHTVSGGSITIRARDSEADVLIEVMDTGCGIPRENIPYIFERFYRIEGNGSPGSGIGLDLCKKIVEAHGGSICAESEEGKGSCFTIKLPSMRQHSAVRPGEKLSRNLL